MKRLKISIVLIPVLLAALSFCFNSKEKYFEGVIVYKHSYLPKKNENVDTNKMRLLYGDKSTFHFKKGNYYQKFYGEYLQYLICNLNLKCHFVKNRASDSLICYDITTQKFSASNLVFVDSTISILDFKCKKFSMTVENKFNNLSKNNVYFYSDKLKVNPKWFKDDNYGAENKKAIAIKSIPLKIISEYDKYYLIMEATSVTNTKINDTLFIPAAPKKPCIR